MTATETPDVDFQSLGIPEPLMKALKAVGYETPTPIQALIMPFVMAGRDVVGQAQTGTGKTAAFAIPLLARIDLKDRSTQVLVLTPTRELAIQVAEAFQRYAAFLQGFHVVPIYGGQDYKGQFRHLDRGVHVVVGTPGRIMDHMRRGSLKLNTLRCLVLDEADEMLRMGFVDDVEWILEQTPPTRQIALFSATMPAPIRRIAHKHLKNPEEISIHVRTTAAETIRQRFWMVGGYHKPDILTRLLETEDFDGMLVFVRTKNDTVELAEKLEARGYSVAPLNGDIAQNKREKTVERLKSGDLDIIVATDVAARGLDVERISHVINYDIPYDTEAYVHRIGRTGRAGRSGEAILFVTPRERHLLREIERVTNQKIEQLVLPSTEAINDARVAKFKQRITDTLAEEDVEFFRDLVEQYREEHDIPVLDIAAALGKIAQGDTPLLIKDKPIPKPAYIPDEGPGRGPSKGPGGGKNRPLISVPMKTYRIEVGRNTGAEPSNIVGAIANEANVPGRAIGKIKVFDDFSLVDLPADMPDSSIRKLANVRVAGTAMNISLDAGRRPNQPKAPYRNAKPSGAGDKPRPSGKFKPFAKTEKQPGKKKDKRRPKD